MSKLKKLIDKYCPNGVEYKSLGDEDVSIMQRGTSLTKKDANEGVYPVISGGKTPAFYCDASNRSGETITVAGSGAGAGYVQYWNEPIFVCDAFSIKGTNDVLTKYLYYCLVNMQDKIYATKKGGGVPHVHISSIDKFLIPVPPIPVQEEIVKILDRFAEYAAELQADLQARQEQYEFYRNKLLAFNEIGGGSVIWMKMSEVYDMKAGKTIISSMIENVKTLKNPYPCYGGNGLRGYVSEYNQQGNKVLIGRQGALCGNVCFANNSFYATEHAVVVSEKGYCLPRYTYHLLTKMKLNQYKTAGAQPGLSVSRLEKLLIPIPSMEMQLKIICILDRFDELISDLAQGLPAEIAAVQEQYEYYRNKLLSFPEYKLSA